MIIKLISLGMAVLLFHIWVDRYFFTKKIIYLGLAIMALVIAAVISKSGIILAAISFVITSCRFFINLLLLSERFKEGYFYKIVTSWLNVVFFAVIICLFIYIGTYKKVLNDGFVADVQNTFLNNLFETGRFSAMPFGDISIMHFVFVHMFVFFVISSYTKLIQNGFLFWNITLTVLMYIGYLGIAYMFRWAEENIVIYNEYLTGFDKYMLVCAIMIYGYWIYIAVNAAVERVVNKNKLQAEK
ncbi:hypothetical protein [Butyrivibrio sp. YAB3001]|uniref:hypothetical protein n=1 Tax=Butyrivibrio sp. YAB3001 TaxID=1520812 RepID=UPI0008F6624F|nr:hypothetical protein [Butyrivibrio sp. YAB3001]SFD09710.1 hypothetical protein SAMN02910398_04041 [Butyrivibrio sp. YAB3001]